MNSDLLLLCAVEALLGVLLGLMFAATIYAAVFFHKRKSYMMHLAYVLSAIPIGAMIPLIFIQLGIHGTPLLIGVFIGVFLARCINIWIEKSTQKRQTGPTQVMK